MSDERPIEPRIWRSLTVPPLICNDRIRKVYDDTTGRTYPVEWERVEQTNDRI